MSAIERSMIILGLGFGPTKDPSHQDTSSKDWLNEYILKKNEYLKM